ncbi:MAG TPA: 3-oxoacyl-[acyl-carrier-protein] synthase III C-terminal domain-containing protein, partial [Flavitalea sp.]|nr:3-oxoacyl-[acyl-carrier-protein] synthase III C-terminal domain-containing protein [Flavitalea sp.]
LSIDHFYAEIIPRGKKDMRWELSSTGFLMTLSSYIPDLIKEDFGEFVDRALYSSGKTREEIKHWCIHPGGKKILESVCNSLSLVDTELKESAEVLEEYGNMSSPTILFILKNMMQKQERSGELLFTAAFGPGLTIETFVASIN